MPTTVNMWCTMTRTILFAGLAAALIGAAGCVAANYQNVSAFQHDVKAGMSEGEVQSVLGEPQGVTVPLGTKLQGWMKVLQYTLIYGGEPGCPETEIGNAILSFATLGLSEMSRRAKNQYHYRLYFHRGRYVAGCRVAKGDQPYRYCRNLESDLIRLGYGGWGPRRFASRPRTPAVHRPVARPSRPPSRGLVLRPAEMSNPYYRGGLRASDGLGYRILKPEDLDGPAHSRPQVPPAPPGSVTPRW